MGLPEYGEVAASEKVAAGAAMAAETEPAPEMRGLGRPSTKRRWPSSGVSSLSLAMGYLSME